MAPRLLILLLAIVLCRNAKAETQLWRENITLIPYPQQATLTTGDFIFDEGVKLDQDEGATPAEKKYFHRQDRARHFANRRADMSYLIYDEQLLDLEGYLKKLQDYSDWFQRSLTGIMSE